MVHITETHVLTRLRTFKPTSPDLHRRRLRRFTSKRYLPTGHPAPPFITLREFLAQDALQRP